MNPDVLGTNHAFWLPSVFSIWYSSIFIHQDINSIPEWEDSSPLNKSQHKRKNGERIDNIQHPVDLPCFANQDLDQSVNKESPDDPLSDGIGQRNQDNGHKEG